MYSAQFHCNSKMIQSYVYGRIFFSHVILPLIPEKVARLSSLCYTTGSHCLTTPSARVCIYYPQNPSPYHNLHLRSGN